MNRKTGLSGSELPISVVILSFSTFVTRLASLAPISLPRCSYFLYAEMIEIEREAEMVLCEHDGPLRPERVTNAELVRCVDVGVDRSATTKSAEITIVHRLVDDCGMNHLVGANDTCRPAASTAGLMMFS